MPHEFYHGKIGRIFYVTGHAIGIIIDKRVWYVVLSVTLQCLTLKHISIIASLLNELMFMLNIADDNYLVRLTNVLDSLYS